GTRQIKVWPEADTELTTDLKTAASGTRYYVNHPGVITVTPDGLITAIATGDATVTVINGPAESIIPVHVEAPHDGPTVLGSAGGVVSGSDGSQVAVAPGVLSADTTVSITPLTQADFNRSLPNGFQYAAAFQLDVGADVLTVPVQLAVPAPG